MTTQQERNIEIAKDPTTPSPYRPQPGICGHCGDGEHVEPQGHDMLCFKCGKWSELDGRPIAGNPHHRGNVSESFSWANAL